MQVAAGLGARALRANTAAEVRDGAGRDPRPPGPGRHRRPGHPARRPARRRRVVGRRPGRGVRGRHRAAACAPSTSRAARPSGGSDEPRPPTRSNGGALAAGRPRRASHRWAPSSGMASAVTAEVCAAAGFDWVLLDLEHGAGGEEQVARRGPGRRRLRRPHRRPGRDRRRIRIGRVLDCGAAGIMLPRLTAPRGREAALTHLRYPPRGDRGVATYNRACRFGLDPGALDRADDEILVRRPDRVRGRGRGSRRDRRPRRGRRAVHRPPRPEPRPRRPRRHHRPGLRRGPGHGPGRGTRHGKACGLLVADGAAAAERLAQGWTLRRHRLRLHPARRASSEPSSARPAPPLR